VNKHRTALLVIDPYNDFISEGGKVWDRLKPVADANNCVPHMAIYRRLSAIHQRR
jgi:nicotinamidase-related amidase